MKVEVELQNHPIFDGTPERLEKLKTMKPGDPNPFIVGTDRYLKMWNIISQCIQGEIARREGLRPNNVEVGLSRSRGAFRVAFLDVFFATADARFRARVDEAARRLSEPHGALFRAYWIHGRNPRDTAASLGLGWDTAKALLGEAKEQVWRMLPEGGPA